MNLTDKINSNKEKIKNLIYPLFEQEELPEELLTLDYDSVEGLKEVIRLASSPKNSFVGSDVAREIHLPNIITHLEARKRVLFTHKDSILVIPVQLRRKNPTKPSQLVISVDAEKKLKKKNFEIWKNSWQKVVEQLKKKLENDDKSCWLSVHNLGFDRELKHYSYEEYKEFKEDSCPPIFFNNSIKKKIFYSLDKICLDVREWEDFAILTKEAKEERAKRRKQWGQVYPFKDLGIEDLSVAEMIESIENEIIQLGIEFHSYLAIDRKCRSVHPIQAYKIFNEWWESGENSARINDKELISWSTTGSVTRYKGITEWYRKEISRFEELRNEIANHNWNSLNLDELKLILEREDINWFVGGTRNSEENRKLLTDSIRERKNSKLLIEIIEKTIHNRNINKLYLIILSPLPKELKVMTNKLLNLSLDTRGRTMSKWTKVCRDSGSSGGELIPFPKLENPEVRQKIEEVMKFAQKSVMNEWRKDNEYVLKENNLFLSLLVAELLYKARVKNTAQSLNNEFFQLQVSPEWQELKENKKKEYQDLFLRTRQQTNDEDKNKFSQIVVKKLKKDLFQIKTAKTVGLLFQNLQNTLVGNDIEAIQETAKELRLFYENSNSVEKTIFKFAERKFYHRWEVRVNQLIEELTKDQQVVYDNLLQEIKNAQTIEQISSYDEIIENFDYEKLPPYDYGRNESILKTAQDVSIKKILAEQEKQELQEQLKLQESQLQEQEIQELLAKEIQEWKEKQEQLLTTKSLPESPKKQSKIKKLGNKIKHEFKEVFKPKEQLSQVPNFSLLRTYLLVGLFTRR